jgi:hypothetical protein
MKYKSFRRTDGFWSIIDQDSGQTLSLSIPSEELAAVICRELSEVHTEAYRKGYSDGVISKR